MPVLARTTRLPPQACAEALAGAGADDRTTNIAHRTAAATQPGRGHRKRTRTAQDRPTRMHVRPQPLGASSAGGGRRRDTLSSAPTPKQSLEEASSGPAEREGVGGWVEGEGSYLLGWPQREFHPCGVRWIGAGRGGRSRRRTSRPWAGSTPAAHGSYRAFGMHCPHFHNAAFGCHVCTSAWQLATHVLVSYAHGHVSLLRWLTMRPMLQAGSPDSFFRRRSSPRSASTHRTAATSHLARCHRSQRRD
jgi:hypothetical protein